MASVWMVVSPAGVVAFILLMVHSILHTCAGPQENKKQRTVPDFERRCSSQSGWRTVNTGNHPVELFRKEFGAEICQLLFTVTSSVRLHSCERKKPRKYKLCWAIRNAYNRRCELRQVAWKQIYFADINYTNIN